MKTIIAQVMHKASAYMWFTFVEPNYDASPMPNWLFDLVFDLTGWLELTADKLTVNQH